MTPLWVLAAAIVVGLEWAQHAKGGRHAASKAQAEAKAEAEAEARVLKPKPPGPSYV